MNAAARNLVVVGQGAAGLAAALTAAQAAPASEQDLPVICNEWCTSWGNPRHDNLIAINANVVLCGLFDRQA